MESFLNRIEKQLFEASFWVLTNYDFIVESSLGFLLCENFLNHIISLLNTSNLGFYPTALRMHMANYKIGPKYLTLLQTLWEL